MNDDAIFIAASLKGLAIYAGGAKYPIIEGIPYYGLTWNEDRIFAVTRELPGVGMAVSVFNERLELIDHYPLGKLAAPHQIYCWDGVVLITDTGHDRIIAWDIESHEMKVVYTGDMPDKGYLRNNHINSIWCDGEKFYICEHKCGASAIRILDMDWRPLTVIDRVGSYIHNVYVENGKLYTCDSMGHAMTMACLVSGQRISHDLEYCWKGRKPYPQTSYPVGLIRTEDSFYVGVIAQGTKETDRAAIFKFDSGFNYVGQAGFEEYGTVTEIRLARGLGYAHNRVPMLWDGTVRGKPVA